MACENRGHLPGCQPFLQVGNALGVLLDLFHHGLDEILPGEVILQDGLLELEGYL